ncbi:hypothetical protein [Roseateles sp. P5_E11]
MSLLWGNRQRRTNQLIRALAPGILQQAPPDSQRLFALCRLTWITAAYDEISETYVSRLKIPALGDALEEDFSHLSIDSVATAVARQLGDQQLAEVVRSHTGFTNFYRAYRNSARGWMEANVAAVAMIFRRAFALTDDVEAETLARDIAALPGIPKANHPEQLMRPEYLLTPVCFALDPRLRFPIINGAPRVRSLLRRVGVTDHSIANQVRALVALIGRDGIEDAADLDQLGLAELIDIGRPTHESPRSLLQPVPEEGDALPLKDEEDIRRLQQALDVVQRRVHNRMTNDLRTALARWNVFEGRRADCRYDVLVGDYDGNKNDLLLEVKSTVDAAQVRMAIGQVFSYWHRLSGPTDDCHVAIVLPERPDVATAELLHWLEIGLLWFEDRQLRTGTEWLRLFVAECLPVA